ncbi:nucleoside hydrolase [Corynebacterium aquilae]|uniref:Ribonucleoside hydrolase n=1 Tax=Corynebacterium aquilae DSM 44791 TaxID=1431546 RepID=A0A1L7CFE4_9CORY|nr:nucleoside hydrolase [Corynebacterium aquilae]APT84548.1 ribonucleoside hydrolase [Corynebacterium aquilae DSM 44791]
MTHNIILDCDPGHDDAVAIILAAGNPAINLLGITTVGGNQTLPKVTHNALSVCRVARIDTEVYPGCGRPLVRAVEVAEDIHGDSGLDGVELPEPLKPAHTTHAVDFIIDTVMNSEPGTITLVPTGPLTNIALAARKEPRIVERVKEVVLMGGGYHEGNWSAVAEFNIKVDPEAAHIVFNEPWPVTMVGLDLTHQALCTPDVEKTIHELGTECSDFVVGLMGFFRKAYQANQDFIDPPVHDPCTIAYLIDPTVVTTKKVPIDVELRGDITCGMTVADFRGPAPENCHTQAAVTLDHARFWQLVTDAIASVETRPKL